MQIKHLIVILASSAMATNITFHRPAKEGTIEIGTGLSYQQANHFYDSLRVKNSLVADYSVEYASLYSSYSITDDLELTVGIPWVSESAPNDEGTTSKRSGFGKPTIGSKISAEDLPFAAFVELALPYGSKDIVGSDPFIDIESGILMDVSLPRASLRMALTYALFPETKAKLDRGDQFQMDFMPGFKPIPELTLEAFGSFIYAGETTLNGDAIITSGYILNIGPGITYRFADLFHAELHVPIAVAGKNAMATQGVVLSLAYTGFGN